MDAVGCIIRTNNLIMGGVGLIMGLERLLWMQSGILQSNPP